MVETGRKYSHILPSYTHTPENIQGQMNDIDGGNRLHYFLNLSPLVLFNILFMPSVN